MKVLIIEDEYNLADAILNSLKREKYQGKICTDGLIGLDEALSNVYDLIILDVMLPHKNGFDILKEIKSQNIDAKIIMLTAKSTIEDKMEGFSKGADDYLTKPFHMGELIARVNIQLCKNKNTTNIITYEDLDLNIQNMLLINNITNQEINVIGKEFELLEMLFNNANQILDKELVFEKIWGYESESDINTLEAYISFLRKKLKLINSQVMIKTIRNVGYKLGVNNEKVKD